MDANSINRMLELTSHWVEEIRNSDLGASESMNIAAISTALVLAVSLRSRAAQYGTVDEEVRFIWLRRITIVFCLLGAAMNWGLAMVQDWLKPDNFTEGLIIVTLAITGSGLAAVVGDSIYSLTRAEQQATLTKRRLVKNGEKMVERATNSNISKVDSFLAWWIFGALLPVVATIVTAFWGLERRLGNPLGVVPPALFVALWCIYVWYFKSRLFDLTEGKRRYLALHILIGSMLTLQGFALLTLATWNLFVAIAVIALTYLLPWLIMFDIDKKHPLFMTARLNTINKEISRLEGDIQKLQHGIKAHGLNMQPLNQF